MIIYSHASLNSTNMSRLRVIMIGDNSRCIIRGRLSALKCEFGLSGFQGFLGYELLGLLT